MATRYAVWTPLLTIPAISLTARGVGFGALLPIAFQRPPHVIGFLKLAFFIPSNEAFIVPGVDEFSFS
jgi:hypothetical protein